MFSGPYVGFFWGPRPATLDECESACCAFLHRIDRLGRPFSDLKVTCDEGDIPVGRDAVREALIQRFLSRDVAQQLGYGMDLSDFEDPVQPWLELRIGVANKWVGNCCLLRTWEPSNSASSFLSSRKLREYLSCVIEVWRPDNGVVADQSVVEFLRKRDLPDVGWITYLAPKYGIPPELPAPSRVERLSNGGHLFYATEDWPDVNDPADAAALTRVKDVVHTMARRTGNV
jgi:hypothetical protein